jgi:hypothetical protein
MLTNPDSGEAKIVVRETLYRILAGAGGVPTPHYVSRSNGVVDEQTQEKGIDEMASKRPCGNLFCVR